MWIIIGKVEDLCLRKCQHLYAETGKGDDLALFYHNDTFYVLDAWCGHLGGPLFEGQIEDLPGKCQVVCPWHGYTFDLKTGKSPIGLIQNSYATKVEDSHLYVEYDCNLSTCSYSSPLKH